MSVNPDIIFILLYFKKKVYRQSDRSTIVLRFWRRRSGTRRILAGICAVCGFYLVTV